MLRWGLVPSWSGNARDGYKLINARAEGIAKRPTFRPSFKRKRCLIPADGFYDWQRFGDSPQQKQPFHITLASGSVFAFAGLWDCWEQKELVIESCCIVTTAANELMAPIHDRMPVILPPALHSTWLDPTYHDVEALEAMLQPYPADQMRATKIGPAISNVRNHGPELIAPTE